MLYATLPCQSPGLDLDGILLEVGAQFTLDWDGIHGFPHWERVHRHAVRIARLRDGSLPVVELFAILHDSCRENENRDPEHGPRAAEFARSLAGTHFELPKKELSELCIAIRDHSRGRVSTNVNIQTCWDADRLDLGRVGIKPDPRFLSKEALL
jgi:uncharacterized protein